MVNREFQALAQDFETLGLLPQGSQKDKVVPALSAVFERALAGGVSNMSFSTLSSELGRTMYDSHLSTVLCLGIQSCTYLMTSTSVSQQHISI